MDVLTLGRTFFFYLLLIALTDAEEFATVTGGTEISEEDNFVVVLICQSNRVSREKCADKELHLANQGLKIHQLLMTQRDFTHDGDWTIFPLIPWLQDKIIDQYQWILVISEHTLVNVAELGGFFKGLDGLKDGFTGFALNDPEPTIIHHFSSNLNVKFPLLHAGILLSRSLLTDLHGKLSKELKFKEADFSIDASYEFALYLSGIGYNLNHSPKFCIVERAGCVTSLRIANTEVSKVNLDEVVFAVKTCEKFHKTRVASVKETWGSVPKHIIYYSDKKDDGIPTVSLDVVNTDHGHCGKTRGILSALKIMFKNNKLLKWAVISDDDTILGVAEVLNLVSQYNSTEELAIGERYGYNLQQDGGYNYLTGGGGVVFSRAAIRKFGKNVCVCPAPSTPDDMYLFGVCLRRIAVPLVHTPLIHQARPNDYNMDYLAIGRPVSFHKHWMVEPRQVYQKWFLDQDMTLKNVHQEF